MEDANNVRKQNAENKLERESPEKSFSVVDSVGDYHDDHDVQQNQAAFCKHQQQRCPALERQAFENVDRIQAVNVAHKRSFVAFIGYKPKQTRDYKVAPKQPYASGATIKSACISRTGTSTKTIKHCFVCGEVVHVAKDCPRRFVEKSKVDNITHEYNAGGISVEHDGVKDKSDANLELDALPFSP
uniref:CCHC-type domain-containing protein n=1 Tax=Panagrolaimus superbus TaxID=310955 RepID=A0A914YAE7_9BILA